MGQLEKYGLYVLCLVIFLILGVTLWGGDAVVPPSKQPMVAADGRAAANAPAKGAAPIAGNEFDQLLGGSGGPKGDRTAAGGSTPNGTNGASGASGTGGTGGTDPGPVASDASARGAASPPQGSPKPAGEPAATTVKYKVKDGDTFDSLARTRLGSAALWTEIQRLNPAIKPERLRAGDEILLPTAAAIAAKAEPRTRPAIGEPLAQAADGKRFYTVRKGDTFDRIAQTQLGTTRRTKELMALNAGIEPEKLRAGRRIELPAR